MYTGLLGLGARQMGRGLLINSKIYHNWFDGLGAKNEAEVAALRVQLFGELLAIYNFLLLKFCDSDFVYRIAWTGRTTDG